MISVSETDEFISQINIYSFASLFPSYVYFVAKYESETSFSFKRNSRTLESAPNFFGGSSRSRIGPLINHEHPEQSDGPSRNRRYMPLVYFTYAFRQVVITIGGPTRTDT